MKQKQFITKGKQREVEEKEKEQIEEKVLKNIERKRGRKNPANMTQSL